MEALPFNRQLTRLDMSQT